MTHSLIKTQQNFGEFSDTRRIEIVYLNSMRAKEIPNPGELLIIPPEKDMKVPTYVIDDNELKKCEWVDPCTIAVATGRVEKIGHILNFFAEVVFPGIGVRYVNTSHFMRTDESR